MKNTLIKMFIATVFLITSVAGKSQDLSEKANAFLSTLSDDLRAKTQFSLDDAERFNWVFVPHERKGTSFRDFSEKQTKAAFDLLRASLGAQGYQKATAIVELEKVLMVIEKQAPENHYRDPLNYHFWIFGTPAKDKDWAWRFEGHHVSISFASSKGGIISSTPSFFGSNPGIVLSGDEKGKQVLKAETDMGFELLNSLDESQLKVVRFADTAPKEIITGNNRKGEALDPKGIQFTALNEKQKKIFLRLLDVYIKNYEFDFSERLRKKIDVAGIDNLTFGWAGSLTPEAAQYYRIQGPMLLIEYDNIQNNANHVHTTVRDLTNDFAEDILREHYQKEHSGK
jgi:Protein of unknown function (DUF3500)